MKRLTAFWIIGTVFAINVFANGVAYATDPIIGPDVATVSCSGSYINYQTANGSIVKYRARWEPKTITCNDGEYLPANSETCAICKQDNYCVGGPHLYSETADQGIEPCDNNLKAPAGSRKAGDCGKILHIAGGQMYLHLDRPVAPKPALAVKIDDTIYYANLDENNDVMTFGSDKKLHIKISTKNYTAFDNSVLYSK